MLKKLSNEEWKHLSFPGWKDLRRKYALSTRGRVSSYNTNIFEDGKLLTGSLTTGYRTLNLHRPGSNGTLYIHREMAKLFLKRPSAKYKYVIHLNHQKVDNTVKNLKWATLEEMIAHQQLSPQKIAYKMIQANRTKGLKLNINQVRTIKKTLADPKRKLTIRQLSEKYGVSEMTMYRIKSGENWGRVAVN